MLASLLDAPLNDPAFVYEPKYDGIRAIAEIAPRGGAVRLWSRLGNDKTSQFPEIADALRNRQVVFVNLQGADRALLQRVLDFTSGVAYTIDGRIQKIADGMFLIVPPGVAVNAQGVRETLAADGMFEFLQNRG